MSKDKKNGVKTEEYSVHNGNICSNCGDKIRVMSFLNTGFCCDNCKKGRPKNRG